MKEVSLLDGDTTRVLEGEADTVFPVITSVVGAGEDMCCAGRRVGGDVLGLGGSSANTVSGCSARDCAKLRACTVLRDKGKPADANCASWDAKYRCQTSGRCSWTAPLLLLVGMFLLGD